MSIYIYTYYKHLYIYIYIHSWEFHIGFPGSFQGCAPWPHLCGKESSGSRHQGSWQLH